MVIPRVFHTFWDGPPRPAEFAGFPRRWLELHPGWHLTEWDMATFRSGVLSARLSDYFEHPERWSRLTNPWQWRSDLARYEILNRYGGIWVDADMEPRRSLHEVLDGVGAVVGMEDRTWVGNAFIGCEPGHPFIRDVYDALPQRVVAGQHKRGNHSIGARYLTAVVARHPEVLVLPRELVYPFRYDELHRRGQRFPDALMVHHWHNQTSILQRRKVRR